MGRLEGKSAFATAAGQDIDRLGAQRQDAIVDPA